MILFLIHKNTRKTSLWRVKQETRLSNQKLYNKTVSGAFTVFVLGIRGYDRINSHSVTSIHSGATLFCLGNYKSTKLKFWPDSFQIDLLTWIIQDVNSAKTYFFLLLYFFSNFVDTFWQNKVELGCVERLNSERGSNSSRGPNFSKGPNSLKRLDFFKEPNSIYSLHSSHSRHLPHSAYLPHSSLLQKKSRHLFKFCSLMESGGHDQFFISSEIDWNLALTKLKRPGFLL